MHINGCTVVMSERAVPFKVFFSAGTNGVVSFSVIVLSVHATDGRYVPLDSNSCTKQTTSTSIL